MGIALLRAAGRLSPRVPSCRACKGHATHGRLLLRGSHRVSQRRSSHRISTGKVKVHIGLMGGVATAAYLDLIIRSCPRLLARALEAASEEPVLTWQDRIRLNSTSLLAAPATRLETASAGFRAAGPPAAVHPGSPRRCPAPSASAAAPRKFGKSDGRGMNGGPVAIDLSLIAKQTRESHVRRRTES
jgi:hypothetical protein